MYIDNICYFNFMILFIYMKDNLIMGVIIIVYICIIIYGYFKGYIFLFVDGKV